MKCTSCGVSVESEDKWVEFDCPGCSKEHIIRCRKCKELQNVYVCSKCGFEGP